MFIDEIKRKYRIKANYPKKVSGRELIDIFRDMTPDDEGADRVERVINESSCMWEMKKVKLADIPWHEENVSGKKSQKLIDKYIKPGEMPPIILNVETNLKAGKRITDEDAWDSTYEIVDGFHRIAAAKKRGDSEISAYVPADD